MDIRLKNARISYAKGLWKKSAAVEGAEPKYNCDFIIIAGKTVVEKKVEGKGWVPTTIKAVEQAVALEAFKGNQEKATEWFNDLTRQQRSIRDGNKQRAGDEVRDGYKDNLYVHVTSTTRMPVLNAQAQEVASEDDSPVYSGCYVTARVSIYANTKPQTRGVFASLQGTQYTGEGDAFGGNRRAAREDFEAADGASAEDYA